MLSVDISLPHAAIPIHHGFQLWTTMAIHDLSGDSTFSPDKMKIECVFATELLVATSTMSLVHTLLPGSMTSSTMGNV